MTQSSLSRRAPRASSPKRIERPTPKAQRTRAALLRAAERTFGKKTYEGASVTDITRLAKVAQGTFYVHFPDKRAVFLELVEELGHALREALHAATVSCTTRVEVEREGLRAFLRFSRDHRDLYRIVRQCEFVDERAYRAYYERLATGYRRGLERAMAAKELRGAQAEHLAWFLMGIADFAGMRWVLWEDTGDLDAIVDEAMAFIRWGIEPRPQPQERRK